MADWEFRKQRWAAFKMGREHGKRGITREDNLTPERFRRAYIDGFSEGVTIRKKRKA